MLALLSSYKSKKVEFLAIQAIHPTKKIRFLLVLQKTREAILFFIQSIRSDLIFRYEKVYF